MKSPNLVSQLVVVALLTASAVVNSHAQVITNITILNNGFEQPTESPGGYTPGFVQDFSNIGSNGPSFPADTVNFTGVSGAFDQTGQQGGTSYAPDGGNVTTINGIANNGIFQTTGVQLVLDDTYTFTAYIGNRGDYGTGTEGFLELFGTANAGETNANNLISLAVGTPTIAPVGEFEQISLSFTVTDPTFVGDYIAPAVLKGNGGQVVFDSLSLTQSAPAVAPEPSVASLMLVALFGWGTVSFWLKRRSASVS